MKTIAAVFLLLRLSTCAAFAEDLIYVLGAPPKAASHAISYEKAIAATQPYARSLEQHEAPAAQTRVVYYEQPQNQVTYAAPPVYYPPAPVNYAPQQVFYPSYSQSYSVPCQTCPGGACSSGQCNLYSCPYGTCGPGGCSSCGR